PLQLGLEHVIEQRVAVPTQEAEELAFGGQAFEEPLLLAGCLRRGSPARDRHRMTRAREARGATCGAWKYPRGCRVYAKRCCDFQHFKPNGALAARLKSRAAVAH